MTVWIAAILIIISFSSLAWGYQQAGYETTQRWILALGFFWLLALWRRWKFFHAPAALLTIAWAIYGVWFKFASGLMFSGALFGVFVWDLSELREKLKHLSARDDAKGVERRHLIRIVLLSFGGILLALLLDRLR